jgi:hypothetical protein
MYLLAELRSFKYFIKGIPTQSLKEFLKYFEKQNNVKILA